MKNQTWIIAVGLFLFLCCCLCFCIVMVGVGGYLYYVENDDFALNPSGSTAVDSLMINETDLPPGWDPSLHNYTFPYVEGANAARADVFEYYASSESLSAAYLSHEVILYESEEAAATGYQSLYDEWIASTLHEAKVDFSFTPKDPADKFDKHCTDYDEPNLFCDFIQQHGKYATLLRTKIDGKALTVDQLDEILRRLDARLP